LNDFTINSANASTIKSYTFEQHPWLLFPEENSNFKHLIVGSLPPQMFTIKKQKLFWMMLASY
jgi:hypothetical protein